MGLVKIGGKEFPVNVVQDMIDAGLIDVGAKHDTSSTTPTGQPMHGTYPGSSTQYGPFASAGARPGMFSAAARVRSLSRVIPLKKSVFRTEIIDILTGVTAGSGNNVTNACAVGPKHGDLKTCRQTYTFGAIHMSTRIVDITQVGKYLNRADVPRDIWNRASVENPWLPQFPGIDGLSNTASQFRANMFAFGVNLEWAISPVMFQGVAGTQNNTYRGVATQWNGLDQYYKTGYTDPTGLVCSALDSDVVAFNASIGGTDGFGRTLIEALTDMVFGRYEKARKLGMGDVTWAFVMRSDAFRAAAERIACTYGIYRCSDGAAGTPVPRNAAEIAAFRDEMAEGEFLILADGTRVPVIIDDTIPRDVLSNNTYKSDIYFSPLSWAGRDLLYAEYFDQGNPQAMEFANAFGMGADDSKVLNDGMYRVFKYQTGGCLEFDFWGEVRIIQDAPFLAARLDDIQYTSYYKQTDPIPGMSYYSDGGVSYRLNQLP